MLMTYVSDIICNYENCKLLLFPLPVTDYYDIFFSFSYYKNMSTLIN
jgi:hypothetical protein